MVGILALLGCLVVVVVHAVVALAVRLVVVAPVADEFGYLPAVLHEHGAKTHHALDAADRLPLPGHDPVDALVVVEGDVQALLRVDVEVEEAGFVLFLQGFEVVGAVCSAGTAA